MNGRIIHALRKAQAAFIAKRDAAEAAGAGGQKAFGLFAQALPGTDYRISYNGRVWLGNRLVLEANGTRPIGKPCPIQVSTAAYEWAHGKKPRGEGSWAFYFDRGSVRFYNGTYAQAKKQAIAEALTCSGVHRIEVGS